MSSEERGKRDAILSCHAFFFSWKWKDAVQTAKKIGAVYKDGAIVESTVHKWFTWSRRGDFDLEDRTF